MFRLDLQRQLYDMLTRSQYWSDEQMREHQRGQLRHLLRHARASVPFYAGRLDRVFRPDGEIDWDRWGDIPVVTRQDLQDSYEAMQAREIPAGHGETIKAQSSGSTGRPIVTTQNELTALAASVAGARSYAWHHIDISRTHVCIFGDDPEEIHRAYAAGGADYLVKPLDPEVVRKKVAVFVELSQRSRAGQQVHSVRE